MINKIHRFISKYWQYLQGDSDLFSLQSRIYHFACTATTLVMLYVFAFSLFTGLIAEAAITAVLIPFQIFLYYLSRFRERTTLSFNLYMTVIYIFFIASYRIGAGISGSTLLSFGLVYFLSLTIGPRKQYLVLTVANIVIVGGLLVTEYLHPEFVVAGYANTEQRFIDIGSTYIVSVVVILITLGYIIGSYRAEREKAEQRAMLLDELHEEKARLISVISHDYQTPLISLKKYLEILGSYELSQDERKMLEAELSHSVVNTQNLLLNLLAITNGNIEPGSDVARQDFKVSDAIDETFRVYSGIAKEKGISLNSEIPEHLTVYSEPNLFSVVIRNFINNAVKYSGKNSTITLSYSGIDTFHEFCVADNGPGISKNAQQAIIESWENKFRNTSRSGGLGLVLAKKYADAIHGKISFASSPGAGTKFYLRIPVATSDIEQADQLSALHQV
ncbi:sensor histidine kinase KdpD [Dyadobacter sp. Leaf189]|uniref:sensor histidine kinase n=1 Tax=Dyadobacter sp. Leaf189 TaxID=1736295 RepID=UPI0012FB9008|nr:HAMP domain-containing sensor histidine kinase [Dyadobacter sp. Leaf189]